MRAADGPERSAHRPLKRSAGWRSSVAGRGCAADSFRARAGSPAPGVVARCRAGTTHLAGRGDVGALLAGLRATSAVSTGCGRSTRRERRRRGSATAASAARRRTTEPLPRPSARPSTPSPATGARRPAAWDRTRPRSVPRVRAPAAPSRRTACRIPAARWRSTPPRWSGPSSGRRRCRSPWRW